LNDLIAFCSMAKPAQCSSTSSLVRHESLGHPCWMHVLKSTHSDEAAVAALLLTVYLLWSGREENVCGVAYFRFIMEYTNFTKYFWEKENNFLLHPWILPEAAMSSFSLFQRIRNESFGALNYSGFWKFE
jgi:hypothetical protein